MTCSIGRRDTLGTMAALAPGAVGSLQRQREGVDVVALLSLLVALLVVLAMILPRAVHDQDDGLGAAAAAAALATVRRRRG